jgi:hypothetical protein
MNNLNIDLSNLKLGSLNLQELLDIKEVPKVESGRVRTEKETEIINRMKDECDFVGSFSKLDFSCEWEYRKKYIEHIHGEEGVYGKIGSDCHNINEKFYLGQIPKEKTLSMFLDKFKTLSMYGLDFPSKSIEESYKQNLINYYTNITKPSNLFKDYGKPDEFGMIESNLDTEIFIWKIFNFVKSGIKIGIYGYADLIHSEKRLVNGVEEQWYSIGDFKTSTKNEYSLGNKECVKKGRQLVIYAEMWNNVISGEDKSKYTSNIDTYWNMLKYCTLKFKKSDKKLLSSLTAKDLKEMAESIILGYDKKGKVKDDVVTDLLPYSKEISKYFKPEDAFEIHEGVERKTVIDRIVKFFNDEINESEGGSLTKFKVSGNLDDLPEFIKSRIIMEDYKIKYPYNNETRKELMEWLISKYYKITEMKELNAYLPNLTNLFYCKTLCGYSRKCEHYQEYLKNNQEEMAKIMSSM